MKSTKMLTILVLALGLMVWLGRLCAAEPMGTAFTYQGHLYDNNEVANGEYDFSFRLYADPCVGSPIGSDVNKPDVDVIDAYFTVDLDFGSGVFNGNAVWLETGVRPGDQNDPNGYTTLSPRQEVTAVPYALQTRGIFVDSAGNVGIGTVGPSDKLDVAGHINSSQSYKLDGDTVLANTGPDNILVGKYAGASITTGNSNSAMGYQALRYNTTGYSNSAVGANSLSFNTNGYSNSAMGVDALYSNTNGHHNSAMGTGALFSNTTGNFNSAMGNSALYFNTTGYRNSAMGYQALYKNTTGSENSAIGNYALWFNTTGFHNSAMGKSALYFNTTGFGNSAMGYNALYSNTTGISNSAVGRDALKSNTTGRDNSAVGNSALQTNTTGNYNTAMGKSANLFNQEGSKNTIIGYEAGRGTSYHNKSGNVFIGYQAGYYETGEDKLYIANSSTSTPLIYGDFFDNRVGINRVPLANAFEVEGNASKTTSGGWLANSDARIKADIQTVTNALETLDKVRLVSFKYTDDYQAKHPSIEKRRYLNVIAQEFRQVFPEYVKSSGEKLANGEEILQVDAYPLTVYSAAAVQELHAMAKDKDAEIAALKDRLSKLETMMAKFASEQEGWGL